ncbi:MAG: hypothetical protein BAJATHORv1_10033 [Candidatus Thorarchaeota archaeon]|nr:MAG: hypothetical protein BAJATHORv1_10033 [Candidatus Thorarchaeota archaeon]
MKPSNPNLRVGFSTADQITRQIVSSGTKEIDILLDGGLELGFTHLFFGQRNLHEDILKMAVHIQLPKNRGGLGSPVIIIDSANILRVDQISDIAIELKLEPEDVMDRIYVSRAFNASQTYDLVMNQLDKFFKRVPAKLLIVTGLPDLYITEGLTGEKLQEIGHMATRIMTFTLRRQLATVITTPTTEQGKNTPAGGKTLASSAQVHVRVIHSKAYVKYCLTKHPQHPERITSRMKATKYSATLPLSYFLREEE